jgi:hypothetical protein
MRQRAREGHRSSIRQLFEILYLRLNNGVLASSYYAAGLYRKDLRWADKKSYLWGKPYERQLARINDPLYNFVVINKIVTNGLLRSFQIPTPRIYGLLNPVYGQTPEGKPLRSVEDLDELVRATGAEQLCFKPVGGWGGKGFVKARFQHGDHLMVAVEDDGPLMTLADFWASRLYANGGPAYICQGVIQQHPELAEIHPESVNTARVWMYQPERGDWRLYAATLRMGVGSMSVDNTSSGGITCRIDIETGELGPAIDMTLERVIYDNHPTTDVRLRGRALPMWDDVKRLGVRTCTALPYLRLLALDVAFGKDAPLVIEVEGSPDPVHQISFDRGVGPLLRSLAERGTLDWRI